MVSPQAYPPPGGARQGPRSHASTSKSGPARRAAGLWSLSTYALAGARCDRRCEMKRSSVREVMTSDVIAVGPGTGYRGIVELLRGNGISAVPVVDDRRHVIGVVSEADLMRKVEF